MEKNFSSLEVERRGKYFFVTPASIFCSEMMERSKRFLSGVTVNILYLFFYVSFLAGEVTAFLIHNALKMSSVIFY